MPRDGSGTFNRVAVAGSGSSTWVDEAAAGEQIEALNHDTHDQDIADAITDSIAKDGQTNPTANLPMNSYRHTGVGNAASLSDYAVVKQVQDQVYNWGGTSGGSSNAYTITITPVAPTSYVTGQRFVFIANHANTGAATLNVNSIGAKTIKKAASGGSDLASGDIDSGQVVIVYYDGTNLVMEGPVLRGTTNEIEITKSGNDIQIGVPSSPTFGGSVSTGGGDFSGTVQVGGNVDCAGGVLAPTIRPESATASTYAYIASNKNITSKTVAELQSDITPVSAWTPTITVASGTVTSQTVNHARYSTVGNLCFFHANISCEIDTTNPFLSMSLPTTVSAHNQAAAGIYAEGAGGGSLGAALGASSTNSSLYKEDRADWAASTAIVVVISGFYEV